MEIEIDWHRISSAKSYYKNCGFEYIEVPWVVPMKSLSITKPTNGTAIEYKSPDMEKGLGESQFLVASSEQSFLHLLRNKNINGKYQAITPCFRDEDVYNDMYHPYFMKLELFSNIRVDHDHLLNIIDDALLFFSHHCGVHNVEVVPVSNNINMKDWEVRCADIYSYDLVSNGYELGSYGIRVHKDVGSWIYGTGLAEPRTSAIISRLKSEKK